MATGREEEFHCRVEVLGFSAIRAFFLSEHLSGALYL